MVQGEHPEFKISFFVLKKLEASLFCMMRVYVHILNRVGVTKEQGCYRYFPKVSLMFDIDAGFKSIVDTDIDTLP